MYKQLLKATLSLNKAKAQKVVAKKAKIKSANSNSTCAARIMDLLNKDSKIRKYEGDYVGMDGVYEVTSDLWSIEVLCANVEATDKNVADVEKTVSAFVKKNEAKLIETFNTNVEANIKAVSAGDVEAEGIDEYDEGTEGVKFTIYFNTEDGGVEASRKMKAKRAVKARAKAKARVVARINPKYSKFEEDLNEFVAWYDENGDECDYMLDTAEIYLDESFEPQFILKQDKAFPKNSVRELQGDLDAFTKKSKGFEVVLNDSGDVCLICK